jgi:hypothetical protein
MDNEQINEEKRPVGRPPLQKEAVKEAPKELTTDQKIVKAYQESKNSIQDIARIFNVTVNHVLNLIGEEEMSTVPMGGDLIDQVEAGVGAQLNLGKEVEVPFTTN